MLNEHLSQMPTGSLRVADSTPWYRRERWAAVCIASVVPVVGAIFAPQAWKIPLAIVGGLLMSASMLLLLRQHREPAIRDDGERERHDIADTSDR